ncbi:hypothetical protein HOLleu_05602 [Holothuria leucospilota]|uniref:Uncharacterized protein n=1 Tax=Holothuria leucospilota TaxID=206669 RepID=A0A9Q1CLA0_HOLLE|nr:hypothetical protein HOLleu_05602 [Holothuria leucospilota]
MIAYTLSLYNTYIFFWTGVAQEPRIFGGDVPTLDGQCKEGLMPVPNKSGDLPYEGSSFTRAVLKEVLDLDAELNKHQSPGEEFRPLKRQKMLPYSLESFSKSVPSTLDKSCNPTETAMCEETKSLISDKITPPVSPFSKDVQRRALQSIALLTPIKQMPKLRNRLNLEGKSCVSELSDSDIIAQGESSKTLSGQIYSESQSKTSSVITCSIISQDKEIQCQIAPVQPSRKEQSTQICSVPNSGLKKDIQIQTCEPLQCDASTQYESHMTPGKEILHSGNVCDSIQSEEILISDDADETDLKEMDTTATSIKPDEESLDEIKGGNCAPASDGKLNLEDGGQPIELLSQSTCSDSFDSCKSV